MSDPLVSIVIPVHNGLPHIADAVISVEAQTYTDVEKIIVENGSTDGTAEWLQDLPSGWTVLCQPSLVPASLNWDTAVSAASGKYVKLLCADDVLKPDCLAVQVAALESYPDAVMVASQRDIVDNWRNPVASARGLKGIASGADRKSVLAACAKAGTNVLGEPHAVMFRTNAIKRELPFSDQWPYLIDLDMYSRVLTHGELTVVEGSHSVFRLANQSWSASLADRQAQQWNEWFRYVAQDRDAGINQALIEAASKKARRMQRKRRLAYAVVDSREKLRGLIRGDRT